MSARRLSGPEDDLPDLEHQAVLQPFVAQFRRTADFLLEETRQKEFTPDTVNPEIDRLRAIADECLHSFPPNTERKAVFGKLVDSFFQGNPSHKAIENRIKGILGI